MRVRAVCGVCLRQEDAERHAHAQESKKQHASAMARAKAAAEEAAAARTEKESLSAKLAGAKPAGRVVSLTHVRNAVHRAA